MFAPTLCWPKLMWSFLPWPRYTALSVTDLPCDEEVSAREDLSETQYRDFMRAGRLFLFRSGIRQAADCEDLLHDALSKAVSAWRPGRGTTLAGFFLRVVLRNEMLNWFRARRNHPTCELPDLDAVETKPIELDLVRMRTAKIVSTFREKLPEADRAVLDCAVLLLGSLGTSTTQRGEPHNFATLGANHLGLTRHHFLAAWDRLRNNLRRLLREVSDGTED